MLLMSSAFSGDFIILLLFFNIIFYFLHYVYDVRNK